MSLTPDIRKPMTAPPIPPVEAKPPPIPTLELLGHVGFSSLPDQLVQKAVHQGFTFNLLCIGETGIGKSTLMESLFNMALQFPPCVQEMKSVELRSQTFDIEEGGVKLKLTLVETAGFGGQLERENSVKVIVEYINKQFEAYLEEEMKIKRCIQFYQDTRIHACLYFISPLGHGLKALDVAALKDLHQRVNVIPIIAQADTLSKDALQRLKAKILTDLKTNGIDIYKFPEDDETVKEANSQLNSCVPFAVVGSTDFVKKGNKNVRARQYPWGVVEVENEDHCDFVKLREALLRLNVEDLRERTHRVLYENYRHQRCQAMGVKDGDSGPGLQEIYQQRVSENLASMKAKEQELKERFVERVKAKENELKEKEKEMHVRYEAEKANYATEMSRLDEEMKELDKEIAEFERIKPQILSKRNKK